MSIFSNTAARSKKVAVAATAIVVLATGSLIGAAHANAASAKGSAWCTIPTSALGAIPGVKSHRLYTGKTITFGSTTGAIGATVKLPGIKLYFSEGAFNSSKIKGTRGQVFVVAGGPTVVKPSCNLYMNGKKVGTSTPLSYRVEKL